MIFKDRVDAGEKLFTQLRKSSLVNPPAGGQKEIVIVSLLRGGAILGDVLSRKLKAPHLPLAVVKISAPENEELAIGALVFDVVYLEKRIIDSLFLTKQEIREQISTAKEKFSNYCKTFLLKKKTYDMLSGKTVILVDDGVATGATMKAAALFVKGEGAKVVIVAVPVAFDELDLKGIDKVLILHKDPHLSSVSQFYAEFPQIEDAEVKKLLKKRS